MAQLPVLLLTDDDVLWQRWRELNTNRWLPARGHTFADLVRWQQNRRQLALIDMDSKTLPAATRAEWRPLLATMQLIATTSHPSDDAGTQAIGAGFSGYCHAFAPPETLSQALEVACAGEIWMGRSLVTRLLRMVDQRLPAQASWASHKLTDRENDVARRAAVGDSNLVIATALGITERTVKAHMSSVFDKLNVADRLQLALLVHGIGQRQVA
ncbi:response regulator transcription factor [Schauerella aestuarii]|uniref:response regulator transcription factor n=1 Tax=Schauerella aestuarii TaxID=2511204 RepID=UPI001368494E|nr:response regulator transcription factor [Achromobacter aestuarii]MYZ45165.1 response regulator transcription factor [Achromobacter aestuarii]